MMKKEVDDLSFENQTLRKDFSESTKLLRLTQDKLFELEKNEAARVEQERVASEKSVMEQTVMKISNENNTPNMHKCNLCHKQYKNRHDLSEHNHVHTGKFSCPRCNAPFRRRRELERHSRRAENCSKLQKFRSSNIVFFASKDVEIKVFCFKICRN